jgi:ABC-type uncharacterized transport system substrate-binding protein
MGAIIFWDILLKEKRNNITGLINDLVKMAETITLAKAEIQNVLAIIITGSPFRRMTYII